jgi:para-aminobenzoate synthetase / 4-amino-4-deoxychorismate lyase
MMPSQSHPAILFDATRKTWLQCSHPRSVYVTSCYEEVLPLLAQVEQAVRAENMLAVGMVNYLSAPVFDSALQVRTDSSKLSAPLLWFGLYEHVEEVSTLPQSMSGLEHINPTIADEILALQWRPTVSKKQFDHAIARIREHIRKGDIYQANYTMRLRAEFADEHINIEHFTWMLFRHLVQAQASPRQSIYGAYMDIGDWIVCSASPEEFFTLHGDTLSSRPMKGTMKRGLTSALDATMRHALQNSEKNRAENVMITDMVRNDFSRIAVPGSVYVPALFSVETYPTVLQMISHVVCTTCATIPEIFSATFPPASITGAPKARAMRIIADTESTPRNVYTGSIGFMRCVGGNIHAQFNVAIRTAVIHKRDRTAEYGVGGGIVWDSTADDEYHECLIKSNILTHRQPTFDLLETLLVTPDNGIVLWAEHKQRLLASAQYFEFAVQEQALDDWSASLKKMTQPMRVRLTVDRHGTVTHTSAPLQALPEPYRLALARTPIYTDNKFLYHKTTHRTVYDTARQECPHADDTLLWNAQGELTESCIANIAVDIQGTLYTPPVSSGLLSGVWRNAEIARGALVERVLTRDDLKRCNAIYLMNSVRGMWRAEMV